MNYFDIFMIILIFGVAFSSYYKGFLEILYSFISTIISLFVAIIASSAFGNFMTLKLGNIPYANIIAIIILYFVLKLLFKIFIHPIIDGMEEESEETPFESVNKGFGFLVGLFKGILICIFILIIFERFILDIEFNEFNKLVKSSIAYQAVKVSIFKIPFINNFIY